MLLIADSGSTKADWNLADNGKVIASFSSMGFNPVFVNADTVYNQLTADAAFMVYAHVVKKIFFFGSGCSHESRNKIIAGGLQRVFANAEIFVGHDLDACAYATCGDAAGIACILGTGSNSCFYDGKTVHELNHGLGYILGDEGSGTFFGKKLLSRFLYGLMPDELEMDFFNTYQLNKEIIIENIYKKPNPNVYMASFATFMNMHRNHPWIKNLLLNGFGEFLDVNVMNIPQHQNVPVHFIGSIAFHFSDELKQAAAERNLNMGVIIKKPIEGLTNYFLKKEY